MKNKNEKNDQSAKEPDMGKGIAAADALKPEPTKQSSRAEKPNRGYYRKPNYYKFPQVQYELPRLLDGTKTAREVAEALGISVPTFYKYCALAHTLNTTGMTLMTLEERIYKEKGRK